MGGKMRLPMITQSPIVIVPGWRDSAPGHWQSLWAERLAGVVRVQQDDWITPSRAAWVASIGRSILAQAGPVVVVAHSLGCIATAHLPAEAAARISGALLVAPADPERRSVLNDFAPVPHQKLPYRSVLVASSNDPYCPVRLAGAFARAWGSEFVRMPPGAEPPQARRTPLGGRRKAPWGPGAAGHINLESGHGEWPLGMALLQSLLGESPALRAPHSAHNPVPISTNVYLTA